MFERYTEKARRTIFFARYEASQFGSPAIETEHLLLGLLRDDKSVTRKFVGPSTALEEIRKQIEQHATPGEKISTSVDMPLSHECKRALSFAAEEAERMNHKHVGTEHLLLGLLREEKCFAAEILQGLGLRIDDIREKIAKNATSEPPSQSSALRTSDQSARARVLAALGVYLGAEQKESGITVIANPGLPWGAADFCVFAGEVPKALADREDGTVPFLCIRVLTGDERLGDIAQAVKQYFVLGVHDVWLLYPEARQAFAATEQTGLQEIKAPALRTENPILELPLHEIFP